MARSDVDPSNSPLKNSAVSRRRVLRLGLAGFAAASLGGCRIIGDGGGELDRRLIDGHVHVWTSDIERYPLATGYRRESMVPPSFTPQELFSHCRPVGVERVVLIQMSFYGYDNSYMLHAMRSHPGVFAGVAVIDELDDPRSEMRLLRKAGVRGFRIRPAARSPEEWLEGDGMKAMWEEGARADQQICPLIDPRYLPSVDRMCERYPDTPVVVDHFGRIGVSGEMPPAEIADLCRLARHPNVKVKVSAFYALGARKAPYRDLHPMIRRVYDAFGPRRLMWASDCPFQVLDGHTYESSIELVRSELEFLSSSDREWILRKTAEEAYF